MKKGKILKILGIFLATAIVLAAAGIGLLHTDKVQNMLMQRFVTVLQEQLQTKVSVDHININLFRGGITLREVEVEDRQGRKMLQMERLTLGLDMKALWHRKVVVTDARMSGLKAHLCKPASQTDSTANYTFIVHALKSKKSQQDSVPATTEKSGKPIDFHIKNATISIDSLCYQTDNGRPRKNKGRPNRGAFDAGHLDLLARAKIKLNHQPETGALHLAVSDFQASDRGSGLMVESLRLEADIKKDSVRLGEAEIRLPHSSITFAEGNVALAAPLHYEIPELTITTQLRDIAQPFSPALKNFTTPLQTKCMVSGDKDGMRFDDVRVTTTDQRLQVQASGGITDMNDKQRMRVHFDIKKMTALSGMAERIVNHFPVKKHMMKQLHALGRIEYRGKFDVMFKKEVFRGRLGTEAGALDVDFTIDGMSKYLYGTAATDSLQLGQIMNMKTLGPIACKANFRIDISKPRTAKMRRQKGGKLPIGNVEAEVRRAVWKLGALKDIKATIVSDGAEAAGNIEDKGKLANFSCDFSFTDTDQMQKLKVKPRLKLNKKKKKDKGE